MARDYSAEYEAREERALERGFDSFYDERDHRETVREFFDNQGFDYTRDDVLDFAQHLNAIEQGEYEGTGSDLSDWFFDQWGYEDWDAFREFLEEAYSGD